MGSNEDPFLSIQVLFPGGSITTRMKMNKWPIALGLLATFLSVVGCGGGGAATPIGGSPTSAQSQVKLYATDDVSTTYDHIWVTVKKITLSSASGPVTVYDNATGQQLDLTQLHDATGGIFAFLGTGSVPAGTYTGAQIILGSSVSVVPKGGTATITKTFKNLDKDGNKDVDVTFPAPKTVAAGDQLVFDFNLLKWGEDANGIDPVVEDGNKTGLNDEKRHFALEFKGVASGITGTAPAQSFNITTEAGFKFQVNLSASTSLANSDGSLNAALAEGALVRVHGVFAGEAAGFNADTVTIIVNGDVAAQQIAGGKITAHSSGATSFTMQAGFVNGFTPSATTINVVSGANVQWFGFAGRVLNQDEFVARLDIAKGALVEGSYDSASNTLTAVRIKLQGDLDKEPDNVEGLGVPSNANSGAGTFSLSNVHADGLNFDKSKPINVAVTANTALIGADGNAYVNASDFWTAIASAPAASVIGKWDASTSTLTATRVRLASSDSSKGRGVSIGGSTTGIDQSGTLVVQLVRWEDGHFKNGQQVTVLTDSGTAFRMNSSVVTEAAFAAALGSGGNVQVEGRYNSDGTLNAWSVRLIPNLDNPSSGSGSSG